MIDYEHALSIGIEAVREASDLVMQVYATSFAVDFKAKDDPVTEADRRSNDVLCERLSKAFPGIPLVAEESDPATYANFAGAEAAWFVDPLDGTREFVARNGEFAVMLGLAVRGRAVLSVIEAPAWGRAFAGIVGRGAWEIDGGGTRRPIHTSKRASLRGGSVLVSRSRKHPKLPALVQALGAAQCIMHGSSGLKAVLVATGDHDAYLQPGAAGMRWDACASDALVRAAGGECTQDDGTPFEYSSGDLVNDRGLLATNGQVHASVVETLRGL